MAYTYEIKLKTSVGAELARAHLLATGRFTRYEDALNGGGTHIVMKRYDPSAPGDARYQDYYEDYFGFRPDLGVTISLNKFERMEEAERTAVEVVALLAREVGEMSRATYMTDYVMLVQVEAVLVLDATWAAGYPDLVPLVGPVAEVKDLRALEAAHQRALEASGAG